MDPFAPVLDPDARRGPPASRDPTIAAPRTVPGLPVHGAISDKTFQSFEDNERRKENAQRIQSMTAYDRHQHFMSIHKSVYGGSVAQLPEPKTDLDILKQEYRSVEAYN
jgi:hypothetical protein